jgi:hypothetical protein
VKVPGTHKDFVFTSREHVVSAMQLFVDGTEKPYEESDAIGIYGKLPARLPTVGNHPEKVSDLPAEFGGAEGI